jgi:hypothetical protein
MEKLEPFLMQFLFAGDLFCYILNFAGQDGVGS